MGSIPMNISRVYFALCLFTGLVASAFCCLAHADTAAGFAEKNQSVAQQLRDPRAADVRIVSHVLEPRQIAIKGRLQRIALPRGFTINVFAEDLSNPRMLAVGADGTVYVTRRAVGDLVMLRDTNGDGSADERQVLASRPGMHGIAVDGDTLYLATVNRVYRTTIQPDGTLSELQTLIDDLPDGGQHPNRTLAVGPDGMLYVSVGSTCNACDETNPESATLLQMKPDGSNRIIFASGLRNTVGFAFAPGTGELYGMDHGIDWLGDNEQYEELNHIIKGKQYGWPYIYGASQFNPQDEPPGKISLAEWAARSLEPVGFYTPHAAPMQMAFYTGKQFPAAYRGDAFVAMRGSWNRNPPSGYEIARIRFAGGKPEAFEVFAQGFLQRQGGQWIHHGRLAGLAQAGDGSLLVSDDTNGVIYRIAYTGDDRRGPPPGPPTNSRDTRVHITHQNPPAADPEAVGALAMDLLGGATTLGITSPAFATGGAIPPLYSADDENISPPLQWAAGPAGTRSYALVMEDPDAAEQPPFVHWLIYNIPAGTTRLQTGVPPTAQLEKPRGALQGENEHGSLGYVGPKPPPGDPPHQYHFQIFALDKVLDLPFGVRREELLAAMEGHVLASGDLAGTLAR